MAVRHRLGHLGFVLALSTLLISTPAVASQQPLSGDQKLADAIEQIPVLSDAAELAKLRDLSSVDPGKVYDASDLQKYGYFGEAPPVVQPLATSGWITAGNCVYAQAVDNPHWSDNYTTISVHGWWLKLSGSTCPTYANVDTHLQAYYCNAYGCSFVTIASDSRDVQAGGGGGRRGNARSGCSSSNLISYRGAADVDLIGQSDPGGWTYSPHVGLNCYPA